MKSLSNQAGAPFLALILVFLIFSIASCASPPENDSPSVRDDPDAMIDALLTPGRRESIPAIAVAVVKDGAVVYRREGGVAVKGELVPIKREARFHIGSNTKAMTALLCGVLVDRNIVSWDTTIEDALGPDFPMRDEYRAVTLEELLSHQSGIPEDLPAPVWLSFFPYDSPAGGDRERLVEASLACAPRFAPGSGFLYSNYGYAVAGFMLERLTGKDWETLMGEEIFAPLGMEGAGFGPPAATRQGESWGHSPKPVDPRSRYADNPKAVGPAGTVHATLSDMLAYATLFASGGTLPDEKHFVSERVLDELTRPRREGYALGWGVLENDRGERCLLHYGSNTTFYSVVAVFPDRRNAIVILANRGDDAILEEIKGLLQCLTDEFLAEPEIDTKSDE